MDLDDDPILSKYARAFSAGSSNTLDGLQETLESLSESFRDRCSATDGLIIETEISAHMMMNHGEDHDYPDLDDLSIGSCRSIPSCRALYEQDSALDGGTQHTIKSFDSATFAQLMNGN